MVVDGTIGVTSLVEAMHLTITRRSDPLELTGPVARLVYECVRAIAALTGSVIDIVTAAATPSLQGEDSSAGREAALAILNGVLGDYLADTGNPLAIEMRFRRNGQPLELEAQALAARVPDPKPKLLLLVHGLCLNDLQWARHGDDRAAALAAALGYTPVHLHYNSGLHVSTNGRRFSELTETLIGQWPVPVEELSIVAHSMGGLVARSAYEHGSLAGCDWPHRLRKLLFLGTPHHGTPLERVGNWIDAILETSAHSAPFARLGKIRSAGITDLRFGSTRESDWRGRDRFDRHGDCRQPTPLPEHVQCYAIGAMAGTGEGIRDRLLGDGLVPLDSALGRHRDPSLALAFPESRRWIGYGMSHLELLSRVEVDEQVANWLASRAGETVPE